MKLASLSATRVRQEAPIDAPVESTVRIPIHRGRVVWRVLVSVAVVVGVGYALVDQGVHYGTLEHFDLTQALLHRLGDATNNSQRKIDDAVALQHAVAGSWQMWGLAFTSLALLAAITTFLRELAALQVSDDGLVVSPKSVVIHCDSNRSAIAPIPWSAITDIHSRTLNGRAAVGIEVRDPDRYLAPPRFVDRLNPMFRPARIVVSARSLRTDHKQLLLLLQRYFAAYGKPNKQE